MSRTPLSRSAFSWGAALLHSCGSRCCRKEPEKTGMVIFLMTVSFRLLMTGIWSHSWKKRLSSSCVKAWGCKSAFPYGESAGAVQGTDPAHSGNGQSCPPHRSLTGRNCLLPCAAGGTSRQPSPVSAWYHPDSFQGSSGRKASGSLHRKSRSSAATPAGTV